MAARRKPAEKKTKYVFKIRRGKDESFIRAKEMEYFEHSYSPLVDAVIYFIFMPYKETITGEPNRLRGEASFMFLSTEFGIELETLREYVDGMWNSISDNVAGKVITLSERDKTVPPETKDTDIIDISEEYLNNVRVCLRKVVKG
ncbi:MAG: hypothetical protein DRN17_05145 [Thermoplasmata archaeon]|nr:MAG: hypothetical protein DRN17_05145 [Thermoplasmata archaeon]